MNNKERPEVIKISEKEIKNLQKNIEENNLSNDQKKLLIKLLSAYIWLANLFRLKKLSLNKLKRLFSFSTEKKPPINQDPNKKNKNNDDDKNGSGSNGQKGSGSEKPKKGNPPKGHGRKGKNDYSGANKKFHSHETLAAGDLCPACEMGKVYPRNPGIFIQFEGQGPIQCTLHELEKLRCNACGEVFTAKLPANMEKTKYSYSSDVAIAMQKYGLGIPFYRLEKWQNAMKIPLPASTQWERVENLANSIYPIFDKLIEMAAESDVSYLDDTGGKILDLNKKLKGEVRTGIYITGIVSKLTEQTIHLFFTGNKHAGENIERLLEKRKSVLPMTIMSDALSRNKSKNFYTIWCKCLTHARRLFFDEKKNNSKMVAFILHLFGKIYHYDHLSQKKNHSPEERLKYHQKMSGPVMKRLRRWCLKMLILKKVEPNDDLGSAMEYLFNHWDQLTQFLKVPGAPICNNTVERSLKICILHRKNSLFFKTTFGAYIGDIMMSLIKTCQSSMVNPFEYLVSLHKNKILVKKSPEKWLPWNFQLNGQY